MHLVSPRILTAILGLLLLPLASTASAMPAPARARTPIPIASVTISPIHLLLPFVEITGEYRVTPKLGVAVIAGGGTIKATNNANNNATDNGVTVWELGAQGNFYVLGNFRHGMQLGAEVAYLGASATSGDIRATASGLTAGTYVGYKWAARFGLTLMAQLGYQVAGIGANATDGTTSVKKSKAQAGALLNLNAGWSF